MREMELPLSFHRELVSEWLSEKGGSGGQTKQVKQRDTALFVIVSSLVCCKPEKKNTQQMFWSGLHQLVFGKPVPDC